MSFRFKVYSKGLSFKDGGRSLAGCSNRAVVNSRFFKGSGSVPCRVVKAGPMKACQVLASRLYD